MDGVVNCFAAIGLWKHDVVDKVGGLLCGFLVALTDRQVFHHLIGCHDGAQDRRQRALDMYAHVPAHRSGTVRVCRQV